MQHATWKHARCAPRDMQVWVGFQPPDACLLRRRLEACCAASCHHIAAQCPIVAAQSTTPAGLGMAHVACAVAAAAARYSVRRPVRSVPWSVRSRQDETHATLFVVSSMPDWKIACLRWMRTLYEKENRLPDNLIDLLKARARLSTCNAERHASGNGRRTQPALATHFDSAHFKV